MTKTAGRRLDHLHKSFEIVTEAVSKLSEADDICLIRLYDEQLVNFKHELDDIMLSVDEVEDDELSRKQAEIDKELFECSLTVKRLLEWHVHSTVPSTSSSREGVKLPKLDVPSFDGNILNWKSFWDQFCISVHDRTNLSDAGKLVYLQQSLRDGPAKRSIEGLSRSGECYPEAIECLKSRYDRPRLIHQTHVRMILEAPPLKSGDGRELRRLHDTVQQHIRALKAYGL